MKGTWYFYVLADINQRLYAGCSPDPIRRLQQHNGQLPGGAHTTRTGRPWRIVYSEVRLDRSSAMRAEREFKRMNRPEKLVWLKVCRVDLANSIDPPTS